MVQRNEVPKQQVIKELELAASEMFRAQNELSTTLVEGYGASINRIHDELEIIIPDASPLTMITLVNVMTAGLDEMEAVKVEIPKELYSKIVIEAKDRIEKSDGESSMASLVEKVVDEMTVDQKLNDDDKGILNFQVVYSLING